ncbi:hypothetical protein HAQ01_10160 [Acidithiobacillus thiooxidans]|uniref:hypothetical protein n=1 Tax=Acidithiobacillus thiooxidans TaxID=930 RepID=UPI001C0750D4|nr:hypothetical protein [Acidithiobacillus thiooxidans]MBU2793746.1 hypothetical protein [Acidithiobacillus thiooxidans]
MQRAMLNGEPISQGFRPDENGVIPHRLTPLNSHQNPSTIAVLYRDGALLTFLFDRSTTIVDLVTRVSRAGTVRKVVL